MIGSAVVVGAGVGGLSTAVGLRRAGWDVTVVERWPRVVAIGAGLGIWPDAQLRLKRLGIGDALRAAAVPFGATSIFCCDGRRLCAVPSARVERRTGVPIRILRRADLMAMLLDAAEGCELLTGTDIADRPDLVRGADVLVGADGLRSTVRRTWFAGEPAAPRATGMIAWRGSVPFELDARDYGETWGDGAFFGLTRLARGVTNWYAAVPAGTAAASDLGALTSRFRGWRAPLGAVLAGSDPEEVLRHPIEDLDPHLTSYVRGKTVLVGDAAHAMTPNLGRGACESILDADDLVARLEAASDVLSALRAYDRARRPATQRAVRRSRAAMALATTSRQRVRNFVLRSVAPLLQHPVRPAGVSGTDGH